jgi:hypothetical protein
MSVDNRFSVANAFDHLEFLAELERRRPSSGLQVCPRVRVGGGIVLPDDADAVSQGEALARQCGVRLIVCPMLRGSMPRLVKEPWLCRAESECDFE